MHFPRSALLTSTVLSACLALVGCKDKQKSASCSSYGMSGTPGMNLTAGGCPDKASYAVKCDEGEPTSCTCSKNGVAGKSFPLADGRLPQDYNDAIKTVNTGCEWSIPAKDY